MFATIVLVISSPLLVLIAIAIKVDSAGPVIYRGERIGLNGKPFLIFKFRTMSLGSERGSTTTAPSDPRITRAGSVLRPRKLDELPQFINVLSGTMSVVGPRPEVVEHTSEYSEVEKTILTVKPGITDYASLRFFDLANELGNEDPHNAYVQRVRHEKNALRIKYVRERSTYVDFAIVARTCLAIAKRLFGSLSL